VVVDGVFEGGEGAAEVGWDGRFAGFEERVKQPVLEFGGEDRDADPLRG